MKKQMKIFIVGILLSLSFGTYAQELGIRLGNVTGGEAAIDGIFSVGEFSRLHADLSFGNGGFGADVLWDFLYRPLPEEAFFWYMGVGPYVFLGDDFALGAAFEIGLEYRFNQVPIALGLDYRPSLEIVDYTHMNWGGFGLNVRWVF